MEIRNKLKANSLMIMFLMIVIGITAVIGIRFIQKNITTLTQKSTPYQIKTLDHQRALQAHVSNLIKASGSESADEFSKNTQSAKDSLAEEIESSKELMKFGGNKDSSEDEIIDKTNSIIDITKKRLQLQSETQAAIKSMRERLSDASAKLGSLDSSIRKLQQHSAVTMMGAIKASSLTNQQAGLLSTVRDGLKDLDLYSTRILVITDKRSLADIKTTIESTGAKVLKAAKSVKWPDRKTGNDVFQGTKDITAKLSDAATIRLKAIKDDDDSLTSKAEKVAKDASYSISYLTPSILKMIDKTDISLSASSKGMAGSISSFSETNAILIESSSMILSSAFIASQINFSISIKNVPDFNNSVSLIEKEFQGIDATSKNLLSKLEKNQFANEITLLKDSADALGTVRKGFLDKGGAADMIRASLKNIEDVARLNQKMKDMVHKQIEESGKDVEAAQKSQEGSIAAVRSAVRTTIILIFSVALIAVIATVVSGRWIGRSITSPIMELISVAEGFGNGDFSRRMDENRKDEFGNVAVNFNQAMSKIGEITSQLKKAIDGLSQSAANLITTADEVNKGALEQATATEQSVATIRLINSSIDLVSKNARNVADASKGALDTANEGKAVVQRTVKGMNEIAGSVINAASTIGKLNESSGRIGDILDTINDIAAKTRLLSLNATIEATKAGEQGKGFGVVADEVRKLAQSTAEATKEISVIIDDIQKATQDSVSAMNSGKTKVEEGVKLSGEASHSLEAILMASKRGVEMAGLIASSAEEQNSASGEVSQSIERIAGVTNNLKESMGGIIRASEELSMLARGLSDMAQWFKVNVS